MTTQSKPGRPTFRFCAVLAAALAMSALTMPAHAAEVTSDVTFVAKADEVWAAIGPFCAIGDWYPNMKSCTEEQMNGATLRHLVAADGSKFLEKLVSRDDAGMTYTYTIEEGSLPVADYVATISVMQIGDETRVEWTGTFKPSGATQAEAIDVMTGVYDAGLEAIRQSFAK